MRFSTWLLLAFTLLVACAPPGGAPEASSPAAPQRTIPTVAPQTSSFYGLPTFRVGETAEFDGFGITLTDVELDGTELRLTLNLANETDGAIDLAWAIQLHHGADYVPPIEQAADETSELLPLSTVSNVWRYDLSERVAADAAAAQTGDVLADYLLLYAPRGWSGPVIVYRLDTPH